MTNDLKFLGADDEQVTELSSLPQLLPLHSVEDRGPTFRNAKGVARKTADMSGNFATVRAHRVQRRNN
jgi:hypothetical protein